MQRCNLAILLNITSTYMINCFGVVASPFTHGQTPGRRKRLTENASQSKKLFPRQPNIRTNRQKQFSATCQIREGSLMAMIYTRSHSFLPALKSGECSNRELLAQQVCDGGSKEVGEEISTEDRLWNNLWYPTLLRLIVSNNIQVIFGIVVNDVLIIEKCSSK